VTRRRWRIPRVRVSEVPDLCTALVVAVVVEVGLRTTTLPRLARALGTPLAVDGHDAFAERADAVLLPRWAVLRVHVAERVLRHWPFGDTCLRQALVCGWMVRRLRPALQLGVAKVEGEVRAHAWLIVGGTVVDPRRAVSSYQPLAAAVRTGAA
jgi:Transglutaminase-like superfamily